MAKSAALTDAMSGAIEEMSDAMADVTTELADAIDADQVAEVVRKRRRPLLRLLVLLALAGIGIAVAKKLMSGGQDEVAIDLADEPAEDTVPAA